jgi:hypothetical protein
MMDHPGDEARQVGEALAWIVGVLERHGVPYQVVGGLAARAYGAVRPIVDVDLYVPFDRAGAALEEIRPNVVWGPEHHAGEDWDLTFLKVDFRGQRVELGDSSSEPGSSIGVGSVWSRSVSTTAPASASSSSGCACG